MYLYLVVGISLCVYDSKSILLCTLFIGFGLYHLYLHRRNPQLDSLLWFGLVAINIGIYGLMLTQWKYLTGWPFLALKKIELAARFEENEC